MQQLLIHRIQSLENIHHEYIEQALLDMGFDVKYEQFCVGTSSKISLESDEKYYLGEYTYEYIEDYKTYTQNKWKLTDTQKDKYQAISDIHI